MVAALYRRYRPESFSEMIGQSQVTEPLMTALRNGRVGHAYLFSGPRGCGKTTSARILARCLNCAEGPTDNPCGVCPSCIELSRDGGGSLDVVEIDAASHGGVDDARDLRERAVFAPARDRFKIFIIDEAHMVTSAGFNALLKIVEEPPPHVKFVFATTEPEKVIGTIRSRTHHYPFRLIAPGVLIDYVQSLCDSEGVQIEPGVLPLVVRAGGGSARDTLSILDQLIAGSEANLVTADRAAGLLGFTGSELLDDVVTAFGSHDAAAAFYATDRVVQTGQDPRRFVEDLLERLRDLIVVSATSVEGAAAVFRGVPQDQLTRMFEQAQRFGSGELSRIADVTSETLDRMVGATAPRLQLELMIARALVALDELRAAATAPMGMPRGGAQQAQQPMQGQQGQQAPQAQQPTQMQQAQMQQRVQPQTPAQTPAQAPAQPQAPAQDPISALAAARGAVTQPAPQQPAPQQSAPQPGTSQGAPTSRASAQGSPVPTPTQAAPSAPNAAQTAASVRDFLREDAAGSQQGMPAGQPQQDQATPAPTQPAPNTPAPHAPVQTAPMQTAPAASQGQAAPGQAAPEQPAQQQPVPTQPATPAQPAPAPAAQAPHDPSKPHPNEGAAGFGRSISAVLSAAQIASIGAEPTKPIKPETPAAQPNQAPQSAQAPGAPGQPGTAQVSAAQPAAQAPGQPDSQSNASQSVSASGSVDGHPVESVDAEIADDAEGGLSDLLEVWPDLLEEILEQDRGAWNAVKSVQPLSLEGDVLAVGIASRSDLEAFKASGAGPLREAILSAVGITVRYVPRPLPQGGAPAAPADEPAEPAAEEPHRAPPSATPSSVTPSSATSASAQFSPQSGTPAAAQANDNDPVARAAARLSALGPALAAPAWADPVPEALATVAAPTAQAPTAQRPVSEATVSQPSSPQTTEAQMPETQTTEPQTTAAPASAEAPAAAEVPAAAEESSAPSPAALTPDDPTQGSASAQNSNPALAQNPAQAQNPEPARAGTPESAPAGAAQAPTSTPNVSTGGGASAAEPASVSAAGTPERPQVAAKPPARPAMDDPYANDPYAGEPSDDSYDDPYASGQGGSFTPAAQPTPTTQPTPAAQAAPAQRVADPEQQRATQPAAASQAPAQQSALKPLEPQQPEPQRTSSPTFTRYGEAVVRETLGARFLEELPLAPQAPQD